jgi:hypothetical protein
VIKGIKAGLDFLRSPRRNRERESATQDEELFI